MKKLWLCLWIALFCIAACKKGKETPKNETKPAPVADNTQVILKIKETSFTNQDFKNYLQLRYSSILGENTNSRMLQILFNQFAEEKLVLSKISEEGITADDADIEDYMKKFNLSDNQQIDRQQIADTVKIQKYLMLKLYSAIQVTEAEMEKFYQEHMAEYRKDEEIYLHQIMVRDKEKAIQIRSELLNAPQRFEEIARRDSESPEKDEGGKMGYFQKGQLPQDMENVVFSLKVGNISPIVETPYGFYIFKISQHRGAKQLSFLQIKPDIQQKLLSEKMSNTYQNFINQLKNEIPMQIFQDKLYFQTKNPVQNGEPNE